MLFQAPERPATAPVMLRISATLLIGATIMSGCSGGLTTGSSCSEFNETPYDERQRALVEIASDIKPEVGSMELANAMLNVEYLCEQSPDRKLGDAIENSLF